MSVIMVLPKIGVNMTEAQIMKWLVKPGDIVSEGDAIAEAETDKSTQDIYSDKTGTVKDLLAQEGDVVACNAPLIEFWEEHEASAAVGKTAGEHEASVAAGKTAGEQISPPAAPETVKTSDSGHIRISPLAKKLAADLSIDYEKVAEVVNGRRIEKADILAYADSIKKQAGAADTPAEASTPIMPASSAPASADAPFPPVSGVRRVIAQRLSESQIPSVPLNIEIDMTEVIAWREKLKEKNISVSFNDIAVKAMAKVLHECPYLNAKFINASIVESPQINIGVAVDTPKGLLIPVIIDAGRKGLTEIGEEIRVKAGRAKNGDASMEDLSGGTFTISNLGSFGVISFAPVINPGESAILGLGQIMKRPVADGDEIVIRPMMCATLVFDHRVTDGAPAARALQMFKHLLENPAEYICRSVNEAFIQ